MPRRGLCSELCTTSAGEFYFHKCCREPFGITDRISYMFGDFGNDFTFILSSMFLMKFYTDVMGVSSGLVGLMMMVARIVDAFTAVTEK